MSFDPSALKEIANTALSKKIGARSLKSMMEKILLPHMYYLNKYTHDHINKVEITKEMVLNPKEIENTETELFKGKYAERNST